MVDAIRSMQPADIPSAMELSNAANWNQTAEDWHNMMQLSEQECRCFEDGGRIVATATLVPYGSRLAWIGMVLTRPEYRRRGLARQLLDNVIEIADRSGIRTLKLDATDEGRHLYESLGFIVEQTVERWARDDGRSKCVKSNNSSYSSTLSIELLSLDAAAFGASRKDLLNLLRQSGMCDAETNSYVMSRKGRTARYLGPCVADSNDTAHKLIAAHLQHSWTEQAKADTQVCNWYWDLIPSNREAVRCAKDLGFTRQRTLWRMRRGEPIANNDAMVYAIAGFEFG